MKLLDLILRMNFTRNFGNAFASQPIPRNSSVKKKRGFSRVNLNRFPYNFLFRIKLDAIQILVVQHNARKPSFGTFRK